MKLGHDFPPSGAMGSCFLSYRIQHHIGNIPVDQPYNQISSTLNRKGAHCFELIG